MSRLHPPRCMWKLIFFMRVEQPHIMRAFKPPKIKRKVSKKIPKKSETLAGPASSGRHHHSCAQASSSPSPKHSLLSESSVVSMCAGSRGGGIRVGEGQPAGSTAAELTAESTVASSTPLDPPPSSLPSTDLPTTRSSAAALSTVR